MNISRSLVDQILVKAGRRCCICRRFRPTRIQVHHIIPQSEGGADEPDNLMPICMSCHTDVHSTVPFARRFSAEELRLHRDELLRMVAEGKLPTEGSGTSPDIKPAFNPSSLAAGFPDLPRLSPEAAQVLVAAAESRDGLVTIHELDQGTHIQAGKVSFTNAGSTHRECARYRAGVEALLGLGLLRRASHRIEMFEVTDRGYVFADDLQISASECGEPDSTIE